MTVITLAESNTGNTSPEPSAAQKPARKWPFYAILTALLIVIAFQCDGPVLRSVPSSLDPRLKAVAQMISKFLDWPFLLLYSSVPFLFGCFCRNPRWKQIGLALFLACALSGGASTAIRSTSGRTRPNAQEPQGWYGLRHESKWLIGKSAFNSFPSGHMGAMMGFSGVLLLGVRRYIASALVMGVLVGWSRIYLGYHHFSDVFVAALIGLAIAHFTWHRLMPRIPGAWSGVPSKAVSGVPV